MQLALQATSSSAAEVSTSLVQLHAAEPKQAAVELHSPIARSSFADHASTSDDVHSRVLTF